VRSRRWCGCAGCGVEIRRGGAAKRGSGEADGATVGEHLDTGGGRRFGEAGHGDDVAADDHDEAGAGGEAELIDSDAEVAWTAAAGGVVGEGHGGLGDADGEMMVVVSGEEFEIGFCAALEVDALGAIEQAGDAFDFFSEWELGGVGEAKSAAAVDQDGTEHGIGEWLGAGSASGVVFGDHGFDVEAVAEADDALQVGGGIVGEVVEGNDGVEAEQPDVFDMFGQVAEAAVGLESAVVCDGLGGGDDDSGGGAEAGGAAFDIEELLGAEIGGEAGFGDDVIGEFECEASGDGGAGALGDVGERAAMDEGGGSFERLDEVGMNGVAEEDLHGADGLDIAGADGFTAVGEGDDHAAEALAEVERITGQTEDSHDFGGWCDIETIATGDAVLDAAQADEDIAQGAVVEVDDSAQDDAPGVDIQFIAVLQVVVEHGGEEVVGLGDGVHIADEMEVDILGGDDLGSAGAGSAAFNAEVRAEGRFAHAEQGAVAHGSEGVGEADGGGGLTLAGGGGGHGGDEDEPAVGFLLAFGQFVDWDFGDVMAVGKDAVGGETEFISDGLDAAWG
jgi:hypothetical protein